MKNYIVPFFIVLGSVFGVATLLKRASLEKNFKKIEIACDFSDVVSLSSVSGKSPQEVLNDIKEAGFTTVGISENTLEEYKKLSLLNTLTGAEIETFEWLFKTQPNLLELKQIGNREYYLYIFTKNPSLGNLIKQSLWQKLPRKKVVSTYTGEYYLTITLVKKEILKTLHLGFWEDEVEAVKNAGLRFILRPCWDSFVNDEWLKSEFERFKADPSLSGVIAQGVKIPSENFAGILNEYKMKMGIVEFSKIPAQIENARKTKEKFLCFSPHGANDMSKINAILRSAKERNIQMIYLHPGEETYLQFLAFAASVRKTLEENGFRCEPMKVLGKYEAPLIFYIFISLAVLSFLFWFLDISFNLPPQFMPTFFIAAALASVLFARFELFRQGIAFLAAVTFPVGAISKTWKKQNLPHLTEAVVLFIKISSISILGGIFVGAILSSSDFMLKVNIFRGVKASYILPLVVAFLLLYGRERSYFSSSLTRIMKWRLEVRHLLIFSVLALIVAEMLLRSGNTGFILPIEEKIRLFLEKIFFARPRFKEFLFGHPLIILGFYLFLKADAEQKLKFRPLIILGIIGQVSIVNTFAHIHSPIFLGVFRTLNGLVLGIITGVLVIVVLKAVKAIE